MGRASGPMPLDWGSRPGYIPRPGDRVRITLLGTVEIAWQATHDETQASFVVRDDKGVAWIIATDDPVDVQRVPS